MSLGKIQMIRREKRREIKRRVREAKEKADESWGRKIAEGYTEKSKMFWKEVNRVRNKKEELSGGKQPCNRKDANGSTSHAAR